MVKPIIIASNKQLNGVSQKVAPGLSATIHMKLKRKHSGVKMGSIFGSYPDCCFDTGAYCPDYDKSNCPTY